MDPIESLSDLRIAMYEGISCSIDRSLGEASRRLGVSVEEVERLIAAELDQVAEEMAKKVSVDDPT